MKPRTPALSLALAALALLLGACHAALEPSAHERAASFRQRQGSFTGNSLHAILATFLVIAADPGAGQPVLDPGSGSLRLPAAPAGSYGQGLAVGVDPDGYLLTARHILRSRVYVVGWMDGRLDIRPGRVVRLGAPSDPGADVALIAVDARLDAVARPGPAPARGDAVFAVVCNRAGVAVGGDLEMAAGAVLAASPGRSGPLVSTDVPLWYGDSGGPLLSAGGDLAGINCSIRFAWAEGGSVLGGSYVRLSYFMDGAAVGASVAADKVRGGRSGTP